MSAPTDDLSTGRFSPRIPDGDDRHRLVCDTCGFINYQNPKVVVGAVCTWQDKYLLARRAIEPRVGYWTMPAGYMELGETTEAGAAREVWEEACATVEIDALLGVFSLPRIGQVHMIYRATLRIPDHDAGPESQETMLVSWEDIPWNDLAFPTVHWALKAHRQFLGKVGFAPIGVPDDALGSVFQVGTGLR